MHTNGGRLDTHIDIFTDQGDFRQVRIVLQGNGDFYNGIVIVFTGQRHGNIIAHRLGLEKQFASCYQPLIRFLIKTNALIQTQSLADFLGRSTRS